LMYLASILVLVSASCKKPAKNAEIVGTEIQNGKLTSKEGYEFVLMGKDVGAVRPVPREPPDPSIPPPVPTGLVICICDELDGTGGGCELDVIRFPPGLGPSKYQFNCISRTCHGTCREPKSYPAPH
jgi:hypothetical protein